MSAYLKSAQENIFKISKEIHERAKNCDVRFALVKYRDHPPQDSTFVTEVYPFTDSIEVMKGNIDTMRAQGGGDGPEAVSAALREMNELDWRPNATKVGVLIADAPPHGLGESGDGFPQGCPQGSDPIVTCKAMAAKGITVYAVGVEPVLSTQYKYARDFMMMVAKITEGKFLPLGRADILSDVIVNGALEGLNLQELWEKLEADIKANAAKEGKALSEEELVKCTEERLHATKATVAQVKVENPYEEGYDTSNCNNLMNASSLSSARAQMQPQLNAHVAQVSAGYAWAAQPAMCAPRPLSPTQCARRTELSKKAKGFY
jgi:hypothetical protein